MKEMLLVVGGVLLLGVLHGVALPRVWRDAFVTDPSEWRSGYNPRKRIVSFLVLVLAFAIIYSTK